MIRTTVEGDVRSITLDRTECRNALTGSGLAQLEGAVEAATEPVVYLHGAGGAFCAGADLDTVAGLVGEEARAFARRGQEVAAALAAYDGAVVAGIDGAARGGGVELALACDVRVATPDATLAEPGVSLGLFGAWGGTVRLPDAVGCAEAMDLALSGRTLEAREARRVGLVSRIVDEPRAVASEIAANDAETVRTVKRRLRDDAPRETREDREAAAFARLVASFDPENRNG
jgi:enoyl-CoA hydratase/carnithine racemase